MKLKSNLPTGGRTIEQLRNHYEVEKVLAAKLKQATREERKVIYETMYDELFSKVPDHPRLMRREDEVASQAANQSKLKLVQNFIDKSIIFMEFAPGDCKFSKEVSKYVARVYGVDISDQSGQVNNKPENFELIIYDGYNLDIPENSVDVVFSDQLIEHFHPEDTELHFKIVRRVLKPKGMYVFRTPHSFTGPHDVSGYFSDEPEGFHLKEWTYREIGQMLKNLNYSSWNGYWFAEGKGILFRLPFMYFTIAESFLELLPRALKKRLSRYLFTSSGITIAAIK
jgi:SAM-dependent methyltransferase